MHDFAFDVAHMLAGCLVLASFTMLYQDRLYALINVLALHALILALSVAWQAYVQNAPHLYITAAIALVFKAMIVPWGLVPAGAAPGLLAIAIAAYIAKLAVGGSLLALFETSIAKMRVFRVPEFLGAALMLGLLATLLLFVSRSL